MTVRFQTVYQMFDILTMKMRFQTVYQCFIPFSFLLGVFLNFIFWFQCCHVVERLERLSICKEEYFLLKALVLANSDVRLDDYHALKKFRESILGALSDAVGILR